MIGYKNNRTKGTNNAHIHEDNEQYCFRMPLKLEVHKRYCSTPSKIPAAASKVKRFVKFLLFLNSMDLIIKTESTRKSSNIYLSWTKIEYQNNLNPIALFSTLNKR